MSEPLAGSGVSELPDAAAAATEAARIAGAELHGAPVDLALVFLSAQHAGDAEQIAAAVRSELAPAALAGISTSGVTGTGRLLESGPAVSVLALSLPDTTVGVHPISTAVGGEGTVMNVPGDFAPPAPGGAVMVLADPFTFPVKTFLRLLGDRWGGALAVGGLASGGAGPGEHALICGDHVLRRGAVVLTFSGAVTLHAVVSQGCDPIGPDLIVTASGGRVINELGGRPAYERLVEIVEALPDERRELVSHSLTMGSVIDENRSEHRRGDYLIRGVVGADVESGAIVVGDLPRVGQTMRFHVREPGGADRDLRLALAAERAVLGDRIVAGVLFSCTGRREGPVPLRNDDDATVGEELAGVPGAGMLCSGEIGPVGGVSFIHGFTATMALLVGGGESELDGQLGD